MAHDLTSTRMNWELLPGWCEDWVVIERERFRQLRLHALDALCVTYSDSGAYYSAIEAGMASVEVDPLRESAHRSLIGAHLMEGNRFEALRQYQNLRHLLATELGVEPSPKTQRLLWPRGDPTETRR
jgi:DNA-binding SARP family transcriptional activator